MIKAIGIAVIAVCAGLAAGASAGETPTTAATGNAPSPDRALPEGAPVEIEKPMHTDEPMQTGMMKKGMMKGDVKKSADRHAEKLNKELEKEEESMPSMPAPAH